jgi:hypothetical protein
MKTVESKNKKSFLLFLFFPVGPVIPVVEIDSFVFAFLCASAVRKVLVCVYPLSAASSLRLSAVGRLFAFGFSPEIVRFLKFVLFVFYSRHS